MACILRIIACTSPTVSTTCRKSHRAGADVRVRERVVVVGVGVGDAAAARRHAGQLALVERLEEHRDRPRLGHLLDVDQLVGRPDLAGGNHVLHLRHHHRQDGERPGDAGGLGDHADFHHLRLDLTEAGDQPFARRVGDEDAAGADDRVDDVAGAQRELLDHAVHASLDQRLVELDLGLRERGLGARLLRRQRRGDAGLLRRLVGERRVERALAAVDHHLQPLDLAQRDGVGIAPPELGPDVELLLRLRQRAARLGDLAVRRRELALGHHRLRLHLGDAPPRRLHRRPLLGIVEPEQRLAGLDPLVGVHIDL